MAYPTEKEYFAECERLSGNRWNEFLEWYSFKTAYEEGIPARRAVADCREWLDA